MLCSFETSVTKSRVTHIQGHIQSLLFRKALSAYSKCKGKPRRRSWTEPGTEPRALAIQLILTQCLHTPLPPPAPARDVLNTLSSSQHVFSLQFFISNIHLSFGLLSNVMWMETRCLFWTQQNKRRVTEPILPQSKLVLTTTPTVGDRLCGTGPVLI